MFYEQCRSHPSCDVPPPPPRPVGGWARWLAFGLRARSFAAATTGVSPWCAGKAARATWLYHQALIEDGQLLVVTAGCGFLTP